MAEEYNYHTFRKSMVENDMHFHSGIAPGMRAPDFELPAVGGGRFKLGESLRQSPVLLTFGSIT